MAFRGELGQRNKYGLSPIIEIFPPGIGNSDGNTPRKITGIDLSSFGFSQNHTVYADDLFTVTDAEIIENTMKAAEYFASEAELRP